MHRHLLAAALAAVAALPAAAQSPADFLPIEPGATDARLDSVAPPETPPAPGAIPAGAAGGGPVFTLRDVALDGATALAPADLAPIWAALVGTDVTLGTLEVIAERIGAAYRARGYVLSQAVLPAQTVTDGVVRITVVEGFIDQVALTGGAPGQQTYAGRLFAPVVEDRPLRLTTLERSVLLSRDTFAGTVETVLEPSPDTFGAADLGVLLAPDPFTGFAALDNRGSRLFGQWTAVAGGSAYNLMGLNERLDGLVAASLDGASLAYGQVRLEVPLPALDGTALDGGRLVLEGDVSRAEPDLKESGFPEDVTTITNETNLRAGLFVPFVRTRAQNVFGRLSLDWQDSESTTGFADTETPSKDRLLVLEARATWDRADRFGGVSLLDATVRQGLDVGNVAVEAEGPSAGKPDFTLAALRLSRLQRLAGGPWSLYAEAIGQAASTVLPNSERFSLGDATIGRGFAPGNTTGDSGYGGRLELRRLILGSELGGAVEAAELYAFGDYGRAHDRSLDRDGTRWESLGSAGIGARIDVTAWLTLTPEIARQTTGVATDTTGTGRETRAYIGAVARF